jgi:hypothetical protein
LRIPESMRSWKTKAPSWVPQMAAGELHGDAPGRGDAEVLTDPMGVASLEDLPPS